MPAALQQGRTAESAITEASIRLSSSQMSQEQSSLPTEKKSVNKADASKNPMSRCLRLLLKTGKASGIKAESENSCRLNAGACRDFTDEQFNKAQATGLKDGRLYKMAGNAVSVPVISAIGQKIKEIYYEQEKE